MKYLQLKFDPNRNCPPSNARCSSTLWLVTWYVDSPWPQCTPRYMSIARPRAPHLTLQETTGMLAVVWMVSNTTIYPVMEKINVVWGKVFSSYRNQFPHRTNTLWKQHKSTSLRKNKFRKIYRELVEGLSWEQKPFQIPTFLNSHNLLNSLILLHYFENPFIPLIRNSSLISLTPLLYHLFWTLKQFIKTTLLYTIPNCWSVRLSIGRSVYRFVSRSVSQLIGSSVDQLVSWLVSHLKGCSVDWSVSWSVGQLIGLSVDQLVSQLKGWSVDCSVSWSVGQLINWSLDWSVGQLDGWMFIDRLSVGDSEQIQ